VRNAAEVQPGKLLIAEGFVSERQIAEAVAE
jgi:hypothetical protein